MSIIGSKRDMKMISWHKSNYKGLIWKNRTQYKTIIVRLCIKLEQSLHSYFYWLSVRGKMVSYRACQFFKDFVVSCRSINVTATKYTLYFRWTFSSSFLSQYCFSKFYSFFLSVSCFVCSFVATLNGILKRLKKQVKEA
jgi:hypothetical protein